MIKLSLKLGHRYELIRLINESDRPLSRTDLKPMLALMEALEPSEEEKALYGIEPVMQGDVAVGVKWDKAHEDDVAEVGLKDAQASLLRQFIEHRDQHHRFSVRDRKYMVEALDIVTEAKEVE